MNREESKQKLRRRLRRSGICKVVALAAAGILTFTCLIGVSRAETTDMRPAIHAGDLLVYLRPGCPAGSDVFLYRMDEETSGGQGQAEGSGAGTALDRQNPELMQGEGSAGALGQGNLQVARLQTTEGLPGELSNDGIPVLRSLPAKEQIKGRLVLIIRRRPI